MPVILARILALLSEQVVLSLIGAITRCIILSLLIVARWDPVLVYSGHR